MLVLIDESLPRQLRNALTSHDAGAVEQMGWHGTSNEELLRHAEAAGFNVLITADRNLEHQQNVARLGLGVVVLMVPRTDREDVLLLVPEIQEAIDHIEPGGVLHVGVDPRRSRSGRS